MCYLTSGSESHSLHHDSSQSRHHTTYGSMCYLTSGSESHSLHHDSSQSRHHSTTLLSWCGPRRWWCRSRAPSSTSHGSHTSSASSASHSSTASWHFKNKK